MHGLMWLCTSQSQSDSGWWHGSSNGREGWFPVAFTSGIKFVPRRGRRRGHTHANRLRPTPLESIHEFEKFEPTSNERERDGEELGAIFPVHSQQLLDGPATGPPSCPPRGQNHAQWKYGEKPRHLFS
eukprot:2217718-Rhodomonas_salina.1